MPSHSVVSDSLQPWDCSPPGSSVHGSGKNTKVYYQFLLQRIFSTPGTKLLSCIADGFLRAVKPGEVQYLNKKIKISIITAGRQLHIRRNVGQGQGAGNYASCKHQGSISRQRKVGTSRLTGNHPFG